MKHIVYPLLGTLAVVGLLLAFSVQADITNEYTADFEADNNENLEISDASQTGLDITGDFTFEIWFKPESISGNHHFYDKHFGADGRRGYRWLMDSNSVFVIMCTTAEVCETYDFTGLVPIVGQWQHVAVAWDASASSMDGYLNGKFVETVTGANTSIHNNGENFTIGANSDGGFPQADYFDGLLDEARVWNDIRTAAEIKANYDIRLTGSEANLQGYWRLENNALDETTNNNDLSNINTVLYQRVSIPLWGSVKRILNNGKNQINNNGTNQIGG